MSDSNRASPSLAALRLELERDGAQHYPRALDSRAVGRLQAGLRPLPDGRAGARLGDLSCISSLIARADEIARDRLGSGARAVRALVLDKNKARNWSLAWHQDRVIAVGQRRLAPGYRRWTVKDGIVHVEPPFRILERMLTLRIHLDDAGPGNAPLLIAPGSHRLGSVPEAEIGAAVARLGTAACTARAGDIWLYGASILHASERAREPSRRRVLQLSYSADQLGHGLQWAGIEIGADRDDCFRRPRQAFPSRPRPSEAC